MTPVKQAFTGVPFLRHCEGHLRLSITHPASNRRFYPRFARRCSVVETPGANLVAGMKWFLGTYTARFNRRHKLFGHLFSGRDKSLIVDGSVCPVLLCLMVKGDSFARWDCPVWTFLLSSLWTVSATSLFRTVAVAEWITLRPTVAFWRL